MKQRAFTLVELLVVIAIIALLMAILMPALRLAKDQATAIICVSNLKTISLAWFTYTNENNGELVGGHIANNNWVHRPPSGDNTIRGKKIGIKEGLLFPYVKEVDVYHCPGDARIDMPDQEAFRTYSIAGGANGEGWRNSYKIAETIAEIRSPGKKYIFVEECDPRGWNVGSWVMNLNMTDEWVDPLAIWHNDKSTLGFADSHAEKHKWVDKSTIEAAKKAAAGDRSSIFQQVPTNEGEDFRFMKMGFPRSEL
jgi:prepilin-type N-terminal cleavage/methylation domain-containing protein